MISERLGKYEGILVPNGKDVRVLRERKSGDI